MSDWYSEALDNFRQYAVEELDIPLDTFMKVYQFLSNEGFIDYDTVKELLYENFYEPDPQELDGEY